MLSTIKNYLPLFKFRICSFITFSAVVGLISTSPINISASHILALIVVTMMASAGASMFNHYFDMDIDGVMQRTKKRPMPSDRIGDSKVILLTAVGIFIISILLSYKILNYMAGLHLFLGGFVYAVVYTIWLKRRSWLNIVIGGLAGSFAVLAGGASATPELCLPPVLLAITMFFWTPSHFWSFAILYKEEYEKAGIPMLPNVIGDSKTARYILINTILLVVSSFLPLLFGYFGFFYIAAAVSFGTFFIIRNIQLLSNISKEIAWKNFKASMIYLGGLFLAVIIDVITR
ncbi:MAG: protoheme IX farnesyltransferase [Deltaproteobacteria bacterium]|nr:protoheme IX farnesyltransferase [Deltaproteobacteria bacterium]